MWRTIPMDPRTHCSFTSKITFTSEVLLVKLKSEIKQPKQGPLREETLTPSSEVKLFHKVVRVGVFSMGWWRHRTRTNKSLPQLLFEPASCNGLNGGRGAEESYLKEDTIERSSRTREGVRMDWYDPNYANGRYDIHAREASLAH